MKKILFSSLLFICAHSYSQTDSSGQKKVRVGGGLQFISNQTYAGRADSLKLPVLIPEFNFEFQKGFFINTKGYLNLSGGKTTFDGVSIEPGYEFSKENWNGSLSVIKNFISDSSNLIIAPVKASLEFYLNKETKILTPYIGSEYVFSAEGNDVIVYGGLSKNISFSKEEAKASMSVEPSFGLTGGSQNFYYSFLKSFSSNGQSRGVGKGRGRGNSGSTTTTTTTTTTVQQQSKQFTLLASSFELPITLTAKKFKWVTTPALETPINLIKGSGGQSSASIFYITTELLINF
ncbi:MAG TPA: hypothetical protein VNT20_12295 [Flavisolibacter sp.]|jgi:hypothetical protein|nr:hypothetical protein [Flavisolibacter sp.]